MQALFGAKLLGGAASTPFEYLVVVLFLVYPFASLPVIFHLWRTQSRARGSYGPGPEGIGQSDRIRLKKGTVDGAAGNGRRYDDCCSNERPVYAPSADDSDTERLDTLHGDITRRTRTDEPGSHEASALGATGDLVPGAAEETGRSGVETVRQINFTRRHGSRGQVERSRIRSRANSVDLPDGGDARIAGKASRRRFGVDADRRRSSPAQVEEAERRLLVQVLVRLVKNGEGRVRVSAAGLLAELGALEYLDELMELDRELAASLALDDVVSSSRIVRSDSGTEETASIGSRVILDLFSGGTEHGDPGGVHGLKAVEARRDAGKPKLPTELAEAAKSIVIAPDTPAGLRASALDYLVALGRSGIARRRRSVSNGP